MNKETESHFSNLPEIKIGRSNMTRPFTHTGSGDAALLLPIYVDNLIQPGDSVKMKFSSIIREMTPLVPVMDTAWADIMFFFVPKRLVWSHWINFWGQNDTEPWIQKIDYTVPKLKAPENGWSVGSLAEKLGYPVGVGGIEVDALPTRAYCKIWNDWFRDENLKNPVYINTGDSLTQGTDMSEYTDENPYDYVTGAETGAYPLKVAKPHDYFTSALPGLQKGPEVYIPLGESAPLRFGEPENNYPNTTTETDLLGKPAGLLGVSTGANTVVAAYDASDGAITSYLHANKSIALETDLSNAVGASITQLRQAFAIQRFYEALARGGSRYIEVLRNIYGVTAPDYRLQRAEYIGGTRLYINMNQVIQSDAGATDATPLGHTGAYSVTTGKKDDLFSHAFVEHGVLMGVMCIRTEHSYSQGINRQFTKFKLFDYYTPQLANISEQAILNKEIYAQGTDEDEEAFGYQEAWAEYRYFPNMVTGEIRVEAPQSLSAWTYADHYDELPTLGDEWIDETKENIARTIAVENHDQFFYDFYFKPIYTRPMPIYSIPGLSSHF